MIWVCADNNAIDFFLKQGFDFNCPIDIAPYKSYIKEY